MILALQIAILVGLIATIGLCGIFFPYPSPVIARLLPARKRWPEAQIRGWLVNGRFHGSYLAWFYRDPERYPAGDGLLAPADGLVTSAEVRNGTRYLVIALSFWDMHIQRCPVDGRVVAVESRGDAFTDGEGREFAFLREKRCPVQKRLQLDTDLGRVAVRLITSLAARRIETWVQTGDTVSRGQRIGRILLGSTVVFELPAQYPLAVVPGDRVRAGETVIQAQAPAAA
jgi:phosphatidylserine decarboxylase